MVQQVKEAYITDKALLPPHSNAHYTSPTLYPEKVLQCFTKFMDSTDNSFFHRRMSS